MKRKTNKWIKWIVLYPLMLLLCFEIALRVLGYQAFYNQDYKIKATPENAFVGHDRLGIQLNPGTYEIVLNDHVKFSARHLEGNQRFVPGNSPDREEVVFLGCSFTYGYGVGDDATFPALVQKAFPGKSVTNRGVIGYGTVQSLLQLEQLIEEAPPEVVLVNFSSMHFMRNTLSRAYRSNLRIGYRNSSKDVDSRMETAHFPFLTSCDEEVRYVAWEDMYSNWWGRSWFATVNWLQSKRDDYHDGKQDQVEVTACVLKRMNDLCEKNEIRFGVVFLDGGSEVDLLKTKIRSIPFVDVGFDFKSRKYTNLPYDSHPNAEGYHLIAKKIEPFLTQLLKDE